jgi:ADP-ribose pyrophosphatase YjhB (NUDIX family)
MSNHPASRNTHSIITQAAFLVNPDYEILVLQLPDGRWQLPGGKLHWKESWQQGVEREILEETGIEDVRIVQVLYIDNWHTPLQDYYRSYFLCTTMQTKVHLSKDHRRYEWINAYSNLDAYIFTHDTVREHIKKFFYNLSMP